MWKWTAVGASVATGCKPCTNYHVKAAREAGAPDEEIRQAVDDALGVRLSAMGMMESHALSCLGEAKQQESPVICGEMGRMKALIAVGAAFGVNCVSSLKRYLAAAEAVGVSQEEVAEIVGLASFIKKQAVSHVEHLVGMRQEDGPAIRRTARMLLNTYLGKHTGEQVLRGLVRRGDGEDIHAVIWFCDLRDSTAMADSMPRYTFLGILNDFFDCTAGAVLDHGGEVLRYIGDAALAIFPTGTSSCGVRRPCCDTVTSCHSALEAAKDAQTRMKVLNQKRAQGGEPPLRYGLALHMGDVTYGNIGVPERLEFTVIGAAANEAARMEALCKTLNQALLISSEFRRCFPGELISLGFHTLRGVGATTEIFTLPGIEA